MEVKVDLSPEQINNTVVEAIAKSAIGTEFKDRNDRKAFQAALAVWRWQRNNKIR